MSHLKHGAPGQVPELLGVPLPGGLDAHSAGEEQVHQLQQLHRHVSVLLDQLLVTALISIVTEKSKVLIHPVLGHLPLLILLQFSVLCM